jgi:hypothetical protein
MFRFDRRDVRQRGEQLIDVADVVVEPRGDDAGDREAALLGKLAIRARLDGSFDGDIGEKRQSQREHEQQQTSTDAKPRGTLTQSQWNPGHVVVRFYRSNNQRSRRLRRPQSSDVPRGLSGSRASAMPVLRHGRFWRAARQLWRTNGRQRPRMRKPFNAQP